MTSFFLLGVKIGHHVLFLLTCPAHSPIQDSFEVSL